MCCPYFSPVEQRREIGARSALLPLGGLWNGVCRAGSGMPVAPGEEVQQPLCNLGYARGRCALFPSHDGPDAVRFTVSCDDGSLIRLYYVIEQNHHPYAHGPLEFERKLEAFAGSHAGEILTSQAHAYVESYLRRKTQAGAP